MASALALFLLFNIASVHVLAKVVLEEGYTVSTVIDGHKLRLNPHSVLPRSGSADIVVLDSAGSAFYTVSFPTTQECAVKRLSGGVAGYSDGKSGAARFDKPRSFAVDLKGNVYVADVKNNRAIRKISDSGVTTIAGGYSKKPGHEDGPAQNASFSDDFEISFVPELCALLISDHGNQLVRLMSLKEEDCASGSKIAKGAISTWALGLGLSCLLGFVIGIAVRSYITPREGSRPLFFSETWKHCLIHLGKSVRTPCSFIRSETWKHCLIHLGKPVRTLCSVIRSVIASFPRYTLVRRLFSLSLSQLSLMFRINKVKPPNSFKESVSLIDLDDISGFKLTKSEMYAEQLKALIGFDGSLDLLNMAEEFNQDDDGEEERRDLSERRGRIDAMIQVNIMGISEPAKEKAPVEGSVLGATSSLVKRK